MLHGVLNMPLPDSPKDLGQIEWMQFRDRARQASKHIRDLEAQLAQRDAALKAADELRDALSIEGLTTGLSARVGPAYDAYNKLRGWDRA
jgi:hypothetical protein